MDLKNIFIFLQDKCAYGNPIKFTKDLQFLDF